MIDRGVPLEYSTKWAEEGTEATMEAQLEALDEWRVRSVASLPEPVDPRSIEEVGFEQHLRRLTTAYLGASKLEGNDSAGVVVCALTNLLGSMVMFGCRDWSTALARLEKVNSRILMFANDEMKKAGN